MNEQRKRALVTGGSGDIGQAISRKLAGNGLHVIVHANSNPEKAHKIAGELIQSGGSAEAVSFDITSRDESEKNINQLLEAGPIQVLVNNAGIHDDAIMAGMQPEQWNRVIDVSLKGFYNVTQPILLPMMQTRWGRIVNMASIAAVTGNRGQANYAAAKAGLIGAGKSLAIEMASRGITVNTVAPGIIAGSMTEKIFDKATIKHMVPMQRAGGVEEVAALVAFLVSDEAGYISSQVIGINGAMA